jgi:hypothetical protein
VSDPLSCQSRSRSSKRITEDVSILTLPALAPQSPCGDDLSCAMGLCKSNRNRRSDARNILEFGVFFLPPDGENRPSGDRHPARPATFAF